MKYCIAVLLIFLCFCAQVSKATNPVLVSPQDRSTVNVSEPLMITALANDPRAVRMGIKLLRNSPREIAYETTIALTHDTVRMALPTERVYGSTIAEAGKNLPEQYLVELSTTDATGQLIGQQYFTLFTVSNAPTIVSPQADTTYIAGNRDADGRVYHLFRVHIRTNDTRVSKCLVEIRAKRTGRLLFHYPTTLEKGEVEIPLVWHLPILNEGPEFEIKAWNLRQGSKDEVYAYQEATTYLAFLQPIVIAPAANATVNIQEKILRVRIRTQPLVPDYLQANYLYVSILRNDPREVVYRRKIYLGYWQKEQECFFSLPDLLPNEQYLVEATTTATDRDTRAIEEEYVLGQTYSTFFTTEQDNAELQPEIVRPDSKYVLSLYSVRSSDVYQFAYIEARAKDPRARRLVAQAWDSKGNEAAVGSVQVSDPEKVVTIPTSFWYRSYPIARLDVFSLDATGNVLAKTTDFRLNFRVCESLKPVVMSPVEGEQNVSLRPTLQARFPIPTDYFYCKDPKKYIFLKSYEIDTYPADWAGEDRQSVSVPEQADSTAWTPPVTLKPNTTYQWRIMGRDQRFNRVLLAETRFTTGSGVSSERTPIAGEYASGTMATPNPFNQNLTLKIAPHFTRSQVRIFAQDGRLVLERQANGGQSLSLQTESLPSGLYVVRIHDNAGHQEKIKVVKQ